MRHVGLVVTIASILSLAVQVRAQQIFNPVDPTSGVAPSSAEFVTTAANGTLSAERVTTNSTSNTWNTGTPGQIAVERAALTGDVTASANSNTTTIANDAVTYAKMQNVSATNRLLGRITGGAGDPEELTGTQATTLLDTFTDVLKGLAPASGGGTTNFLRADGSWAAPPGGGGGAPTNAQYWVGAADATLSAEHNLGALATGLVINTAGTPSAYAGTSCTNQVLTALSASAAGTCTTITSAYTSGTFSPSAHNLLSASHGDTLAASVVRGDIIRGNATPAWSRLALGGSNLYLKSDGTDVVYSTLAAGGVGSCTNQFVTAANADAAPTCTTATLASAQFANQGTTTTVLHGNAAGNPSFASVTGSDFASQTANFVFAAPNGSAGTPTFRALVDNDVPDTITLTNLTQIGTRQISDTTGTLAIGRGGTGQTTITTNQVYIGTALDTLTAKTLPSCSNATTSKLLFNNSTQEFSCGTDQTGGAGSANAIEVTVDFGSGGSDLASTVVTGQGWVTGTSAIACAPTMKATASRAEGAEDAVAEGLIAAIHSRVAATGFTLVAGPRFGRAIGQYIFDCTGV